MSTIFLCTSLLKIFANIVVNVIFRVRLELWLVYGCYVCISQFSRSSGCIILCYDSTESERSMLRPILYYCNANRRLLNSVGSQISGSVCLIYFPIYFRNIFPRNMALVGAVLLLYSETMQEARTIFAGVPSMGEDSKPKVFIIFFI